MIGNTPFAGFLIGIIVGGCSMLILGLVLGYSAGVKDAAMHYSKQVRPPETPQPPDDKRLGG